MAAISREEVAHVARLARLAVTGEELDRFAGQLDVILQAIKKIGEIPHTESEPRVPVLTNVMREDEVVEGLSRPAALATAPDADEFRFRVPRILGEDE
jgi:aspartyl-tRNA(Asn)/glutamyl-tRNA(Gln) amidotransferase subunit C